MSSDSLTYYDLWNDFRNGDNQAFEKLFRIFSDELYQYGLKFIHDEYQVKDCIQDLFIKIYHNRKNLSYTDNPRLYLFRALKNLIIDSLRNNHIMYVSSEELPFYADYEYYMEDNSEENDGTEIRKKYEKAINLLNPRQKEAVYLRYQKEMSYEEISELLEINYQSARNLIHRALEKMRSSFEKEK